jgi:Polyketide cyclase / dehydrase and lipid transport
MSDPSKPAWEQEESVEVKAEPAFAFDYWTGEAWASDPGIEGREIDGPYRTGARGVTHLADGGTVSWRLADVDPDHKSVIEIDLPEATLRFELRFDGRAGGGTLITQRISIFGPRAAEHREGLEAGFGPNLRQGMLRIARQLDEAASRG